MRFALTQKIATYALAAVAAFPLVSSGEVGYPWVVLLVILGLVGWWMEPPLTKAKKFRRGITVAVLAVLAFQVARLIAGEHVVILGIEFAVALLGIKLLSRGYASDYSQIVILSFMHIIAATIAVDDLSYAGSFLLFAALSPPVLALAYLRKEMEHRFGEEKVAGAKSMLDRLLQSKRVVSYKFLLGSSLLSLPILLITAVLFITFPRMGFGFFGRLSNDKTTAGFGSEVELGDLDLIRMDETVLLRLEPFGFKRKLPDNLRVKIRGAVFDKYEKNTWKQSITPRWRNLKNEGNLVRLEDHVMVSDKSTGFQVLLESIEPPLIFLPEGTGIIFTYPMAVGGRPRPRTLQKNVFGAIQYNDVAKVGLRYRAYLTGRTPLGDPPSEKLDYLSLPGDSERLIALAEEFAGEGTPEERTQNLIRALKTKYKYSLRLAGSEANALEDTPLNRFLFTRRTGTCEHFATALTLMLRAVNIPSRLVTGFSGAEWNSIGEYYAVRSRFAHSWTEVFLDEKWVSVDATPPNLEATEAWKPSAFSQFIDTVRMRWHKHVVGYDASSQYEIALGIWKFSRRHRTPKMFDWKFSWWMVFPALGAGLFAFGIYLLRKRKWLKKLGNKRRSSLWKSQIAASNLYFKLERKLDTTGYFRPKYRTPLEHVEFLVSNGANIAQDVKYITERYNDVRFGRDDFRPGELGDLFLRIKQL